MNKILAGAYFMSAICFSASVFAGENICEDIPKSFSSIQKSEISKNEVVYNVSVPVAVQTQKLNRVLLIRKVKGDCKDCDQTLIFTEASYSLDEDGKVANVAFSVTPIKKSYISLEILYFNGQCGSTMYLNIE